MAGKNYDYFAQFVKQMELCKKAARQLMNLLEDYTDIVAKSDRIHDTEHEADQNLHELMYELNRSFITPIDREDIVQLANALDDITDSIEAVANMFDMLSITEVRPGAKEMVELVLRGCDALGELIGEFQHFKNSKNLSDMIIKVNRVEEEGDRLHRSLIKSLYLEEQNAIEIMKWKEIFDNLEEVLDGCEDAAGLLDGLAIKNS